MTRLSSVRPLASVRLLGWARRVAALALLLASAGPLRAEAPTAMAQDYPLQPVPATAVQLTDAFWRPRIDTNRQKTIPYCFARCEEMGRMENFRVAAGASQGEWRGHFGFDDSDLSKVIEGASYCLMTERDPELEAQLDELIKLFAAAQQPDGYLYTLWTAREKAPNYDKVWCSPGKEGPWGQIDRAHQLYNLGHMYEAATAHWQATGKPGFMDVSKRSAELVLRTFGPGRLELPPGHQEVELGLVKLYRVTGDVRFLALAKQFLDTRGKATASREKPWGPYSQDHVPVVDQDEAVGHAVRAGYMYAAMTDVAALTGDRAYADAVDRLWRDVVGCKMYLTGGVGATGEGEAFGARYQLPNLTAYNETCAAIAQCYWNHRMFLLHGDAKYADVLERVLYNGALSGVALSGERFFYPNPLESDGSHERSPWFDCSCCPTNVCRFVPAIPGYAYAARRGDLYVNLYAQGKAEVDADGIRVTVTQETNYPWDGRVKLTVTPAANAPLGSILLRIPGWARNVAQPGDLYRFADEDAPAPTVAVGDAPAVEAKANEHGYLVVQPSGPAPWVVTLDLPMPVRRVVADDRVEADRGRVALQRGPLVYCVEHPDVPQGVAVRELVLPADAQLSTRRRDDLLGGVVTLEATCLGGPKEPADEPADKQDQPSDQGADGVAAGEAAPQPKAEAPKAPVAVTAIPYYAWAHRGKGDMAVWLRSE